MNDNQNAFVDRSTSRVLSQPGGTSSFSIGGWNPEELQRARERKEKKSKLLVQVPLLDFCTIIIDRLACKKGSS
jgi:hypothetical protein